MKRKMSFKFDIMKIEITNQRNIWDKLKGEINDINPPDNFGTSAVDRAFTDLIAALDYSKFLLKGKNNE